MRRRKFLLLMVLIAAVILIGCQQDEQAERYAQLHYGIDYFDGSLTFRPDGDKLHWDYNAEPTPNDDKFAQRYYDLPELQDSITQQIRTPALDQDRAILAYAWELQPILTAFSCIPSDYIPVAADHHANGIVKIDYANKASIDQSDPATEESWIIHDDTAIVVFVAEKDGHIIHICTY